MTLAKAVQRRQGALLADNTVQLVHAPGWRESKAKSSTFHTTAKDGKIL
jgi:hypothetical protein